MTHILIYVGCKVIEIPVTSDEHAELRLQGANSQLNDVVVVGYGTQRRSDVTGAVAGVGEDALSRPAIAFENLLQGAAGNQTNYPLG